MKSILIIGLGRFGTYMARKFTELGNHVMALDIDEEKIDEILPFVTSAQMCSAESRESCPTASTGRSFPVFSCAQTKNAFAIARIASSVSVAGSPATPAIAVPRTSVPFRKFKNSCSVIIPPWTKF